jgi:hypothetical protein
MNCNLSNYFDGHPGIDYQYTRYLERSSVDWDYGIFGLNYLDPVLLKDNKWKPAGEIKTFYHLGNPVAVLVRRKDKSDFYGISEIKNGNLHKEHPFLKGHFKTRRIMCGCLLTWQKQNLGWVKKKPFYTI